MATIQGSSLVDTLNGTIGNDLIYGGGGNDTLNGLDGADMLDGGSGADTMTGGLGNDIYIVDNLGDIVVENAGQGIDLIKSRISLTLSANVEKLLLLGTTAIDGTGNGLANSLTGNAASNTLTGLGGNDVLDGKGGADTMVGGTGNDTYVVENAGDKVIENLGEGIDTVKASITHTLAANVEKLILTGTGLVDGTGNTLANTLTGNAAANVLNGLAGNDVILGGDGADRLIGGTGLDMLTGGAGNDAFVFATGDFASRSSTGADEIVDFTSGDKVDVSQIDALVSASGYGMAGDQAFMFIATNKFHNHTGRELRYEIVSGNTYVYGNVDGDTTADFCIRIDGVHTLTSADFVL